MNQLSRSEEYRNHSPLSNSNKNIATMNNVLPIPQKLKYRNTKESDSYILLEKERDDLKKFLEEAKDTAEKEIGFKIQAENALIKQKEYFHEERLKLVESHENYLREVNATHHKELADAISKAFENERIKLIHGKVDFSVSTLKILDERLQKRDEIIDNELKQRYQALSEIEQNTVNIQKVNQQDTMKLEGAVHEMGDMMTNIKDLHEKEMTTIRLQKKDLADLEVRLLSIDFISNRVNPYFLLPYFILFLCSFTFQKKNIISIFSKSLRESN